MTEDPKVSKHRLFAGCPVPIETAIQIHDWAKVSLGHLPIRLVSPETLHVTLLFYAGVTSEVRDELVYLTSLVRWSPIPCATLEFASLGKSAIGFELNVATAQLFQSPFAGFYDEDGAWRVSPQAPPLVQMWGLLSSKEHTRLYRSAKKRRSDKTRSHEEHHLTVARSKQQLNLDSAGAQPTFRFSLDRFNLYESHLSPDGSRYEVLSVSTMGAP